MQDFFFICFCYKTQGYLKDQLIDQLKIIDNNKKRFTDSETIFYNMINNSLQHYLVDPQGTYNVMSEHVIIWSIMNLDNLNSRQN